MAVCRRVLLVVCLGMTLAACSTSWRDLMPGASPDNNAVTANGRLADGVTTSSVALAPVSNEPKIIAPFGSESDRTAYQFMNRYRVGAGDRLSIRVLGQAELTGQYLVNGAGTITMPLVRKIRVAGLTAPQIEYSIVGKLRSSAVVEPSVKVQVTDLQPFFILGEVNRAGSFAYRAGMTVESAIALAGGYSQRANQGKVLLTRKTNDGTDTNRVEVTTQIYPGDIVNVRERWF